MNAQESQRSIREQRVRDYYQLVDTDDVPGLLKLFDEDAVYRRPGYEPLAGRAQLNHFYREQRIIREGRHTLSTALVHKDEAAVHGTFEGTLNDGSEVSLRFADFFAFTPTDTFRLRDTFFFTPLV